MPAYSGRTVMKEYRCETIRRRNFDTALHYNTVGMIAAEKTTRFEPRQQTKSLVAAPLPRVSAAIVAIPLVWSRITALVLSQPATAA